MSLLVTLGSVLGLRLLHVNILYLVLILTSSVFVFSALGALLCVLVKEVFEAQTLANLPRFVMVFLCGVFYPISSMPPVLQYIAYVLPLTYTVDGIRQAFLPGDTTKVFVDSLVLILFIVVFTFPAIKLLHRRFI